LVKSICSYPRCLGKKGRYTPLAIRALGRGALDQAGAEADGDGNFVGAIGEPLRVAAATAHVDVEDADRPERRRAALGRLQMRHRQRTGDGLAKLERLRVDDFAMVTKRTAPFADIGHRIKIHA